MTEDKKLNWKILKQNVQNVNYKHRVAMVSLKHK